MINLGDKVKDTVSGFQGVAIARHTYEQGCERISVQPPVGKDGILPDQASFDEPQLKVLKRKKIIVKKTSVGGPEKYMPKAKIIK